MKGYFAYIVVKYSFSRSAVDSRRPFIVTLDGVLFREMGDIGEVLCYNNILEHF